MPFRRWGVSPGCSRGPGFWAVAATYPDDIARRFEEFLNRGGIEVCQVGSHGIVTAAEVGTLGRDAVLDMVEKNDHVDAEALLVPDTALHSVAWLEELEAAIGKPVLTANQVTFWEALRLAGRLEPQAELGTLFRSQPAAGHGFSADEPQTRM